MANTGESWARWVLSQIWELIRASLKGSFMKSFYLNTNKFLRKPTGGDYSLPDYGKGRPRNPDFLYNLKNNIIKTRPRSEHLLKKDKNKLKEDFREDVEKITKISKVNTLTVSVKNRERD